MNYWKLHGKEFRVPYIKDRYIDLLRVKEVLPIGQDETYFKAVSLMCSVST